MALVLVNMASLFFIGRPEARWILGAFAFGGLAQMVLFSRLGFVRLLGLGHFLWFPLLYWLLGRLDGLSGQPVYVSWIVVLMVMNALSLTIDVVDVVKYALGEREPTVDLA